MRWHKQILWHDICNARICDKECGMSGVFIGLVPWGQKQDNQQNTAFNTYHSSKDTESLQKPCNYAIIHTSLSEQKNTVLKSIHSQWLIREINGDKNYWRRNEGNKEHLTRLLWNTQSKINAYLLHYYKADTIHIPGKHLSCKVTLNTTASFCSLCERQLPTLPMIYWQWQHFNWWLWWHRMTPRITFLV